MKHILEAPRNALALVGAALASISGATILALAIAATLGFVESPYIGIFAFMILPGAFVLGLLIIPVGNHLARKRARAAAEQGAEIPPMPVIDLNHPRIFRAVVVIGALTALNVVILGLAGYKGLEVMDSPQFCGSCHSVMDPEFTAFSRSAHARVSCVHCHIGEGASWFVKSKLSGAWQVISVTFNLYQRPIPTPIHNLRPARETCMECHWPSKFSGDRLKVTTNYGDDEQNTEKKTVLLLHVGGGETAHGPTKGIHAHVAPGVEIRYLSDPNRQKITTVEAVYPGGKVETYKVKDGAATPAAQAGETWRVMDCIDCHNRPTHRYRMPGEEVNAAMESGLIDEKLPFVKREAMKALEVAYPGHAEARAGIEKQIVDFYRGLDAAAWPGREATVRKAAAAIGDIYCWNVWPGMKITWGTYPSFLGHEQAPGCFRCHDGNHVTATGKEISQDCSLCHSLLAVDEVNPKVLAELRP